MKIDKICKSVVCTCVAVASVAGLHAGPAVVPIGHVVGRVSYTTNETIDRKRLKEFWDLEKAGFDQIPCGTNWAGWMRQRKKVGADDVIGKLVKLGREVVSKEHLLGFMMAPWKPCDNEANTAINLRGVDLLAAALKGS